MNSETKAVELLFYNGRAFVNYACESWNYSYGEVETDNRTGPLVRRISSGRGTQYDYPIRGNNCQSLTSSHFYEKLHYKVDESIRIVVCDSGFLLSRGNQTTDCVLPSVPPPATAGSGSGIPDKASIPSRMGCNSCGSTLQSKEATTLVGDPIDLATGSVFQEEVEYRGAGGNRLQFARIYNSGTKSYGVPILGLGWRHNHQSRVVSGSSHVLIVRPDGSEIYFERIPVSGSISLRAHATHNGKLQQATSSPLTWAYTHANGDIERYDNYGRLTKFERATGGVLTYAWLDLESLGSVTDGLGRTLTFSYAGNPARLTRVTFPDQTYVDYAYSAGDQLVSATHSSGTSRQYAYVSPSGASAKLLQAVTNEDGRVDVAFTYDADNRGTSAAKPGGAKGVWLNYGAGATTVTNAIGYQETHNLSTATGIPQAMSMLVSCAAGGCGEAGGSQGAVYDGAGNMTEYVDESGALTCTSYVASRSLVAKRVEGLQAGTDTCLAALAMPPAHARVTTIQWHASKAIVTAVSQPLLKTTYSLDAAGRVSTVTEQPTSDATGAAGFSAQASGNPRTTTLTWNAQGFVTSVFGPRIATTSFVYDTKQNLRSITDPVGLVTTFFSYDANGRPGLITEPNGLQTSVAYDARGRVLQVNTGGAVTGYGYTPAGLLQTATLPSGLVLTFGHDAAGRVNLVSDSLGNSTEMVLDLEGNVLQEVVKGNGGALAFSRQMAYDALSRVTSITKAQ